MQVRSLLITLLTAIVGVLFVWYAYHQGAATADFSAIPTSTPMLPEFATTTATTTSQGVATTSATTTP